MFTIFNYTAENNMEVFSSLTIQVKWFKQKINKELQDY